MTLILADNAGEIVERRKRMRRDYRRLARQYEVILLHQLLSALGAGPVQSATPAVAARRQAHLPATNPYPYTAQRQSVAVSASSASLIPKALLTCLTLSTS